LIIAVCIGLRLIPIPVIEGNLVFPHC
jgi:hypothetical protein